MMRKFLVMGLALMIGTACLSGCGQTSGETASMTTGVAGETQAASDTNAPAEATDDLFVWEGTVITDLTEKGETAEELIIPDTATAIGF